MKSSDTRNFLKYFLQGLAIVGPISITAYAIYFVFASVDKIPAMANIHIPTGVGFISVIAIISLIGYLGTRFFIGRILFELIDHLLEKVPGIKFIYTSVKEVVTSFVGEEKKFNHPVWVKTNASPEIWRIGFLTQEKVETEAFSDKVAVYLPHAYAISGWVVVTARENIVAETGMNAAEAMKFAVSGGVTGKSAVTGPTTTVSAKTE